MQSTKKMVKGNMKRTSEEVRVGTRTRVPSVKADRVAKRSAWSGVNISFGGYVGVIEVGCLLETLAQ